jgi:hypothetical protein
MAGYMMIFFGWIVLFIRITKGTAINAKKILFGDDKAGWFVQGVSRFFYYIVVIALIFGNAYIIYNMAHDRKRKILADGPTKTAVAEITGIEVRKGRSSTSYYAVFEFRVNGKLISHPWYEQNESDFLVGEKYIVKYSVDYPEMFVITSKLQP